LGRVLAWAGDNPEEEVREAEVAKGEGARVKEKTAVIEKTQTIRLVLIVVQWYARHKENQTR
jgi:hypothetical protein